MVTKTVQEIYNDYATPTHAPTAREIIDAMIADGYTTSEITKQLTSVYIAEKIAEKVAFDDDQLNRLPTQEAWDLLTETERNIEKNLSGKYSFAVTVSNRIASEYSVIISEFENKKTIAQSEFNTLWFNKQQSGWIY